MPQNSTTGARASKWGRETAREIAKNLGASPISESSNEFDLNGRLITIRCAAKATTDVGVTYAMLKRISAIIGAFQNENLSFSLYEISPSKFEENMRDSKGQGKVGLVRKKYFIENGRRI